MSIRDDFFDAQAKASLWDVAVSIKRGNPLPLDANSVFRVYGTSGGADYAGSLLEYATSNPVAYPGQICAVVGENATTIYYLDQELAIQPVGVIPTGDSKTIEVTSTGAISLLGAAGAADNMLPMMQNGVLAWKTLEDIGAGDGNDNTTYEFAFADEKITVTPKFNGVAQDSIELDLSTFVTADELNAAIADFVTTDTTYSVAAAEKILRLTGTEFSTVASLKYVEAGDTTPAKIQLCGIDGALVSEIDATPFIKDGMLEDVEYNADTNTLTFTWNTAAGSKTDTVVLSDIIEPYTAGSGLELASNEFKVKFDTSSESFLTVGEDGIKISGVADAISAAEARAATDAQTKATAAQEAAIADAATKYYSKSEVYTKSETDAKIDEKIASVTGGESAADVKLALESYRDAANTEIWGPEAVSWTTSDGSTVSYNPQYGSKSRIDVLEEAVDGLEAIGAEANVIEEVKSTTDNRLSITTAGKIVTIDDANLRADITEAKKAGTDAAAAAAANATAISGHDTRIGALETAKGEQEAAIEALQDADTTANAKILALETTVNNEASGVAATYAATAKNTTDIATLVAQDKTHSSEIATLKTTTSGHTTDITNINTELGNIYRKNEVYNKTEVDTTVASINAELADKLESADLADYAKTADVVAKSTYDSYVTTTAATLDEHTSQLTTLIGNDANQSVRTIAADEINTLIKAADPEGGKTIEQINDLVKYVDENAGEIAALMKQANESTAALAGIGSAGDEYATVLAAIEASEYTLPTATADTLGGVKLSEEIGVNAAGQLKISKVTTDVLTNGTEEFILYGGNATVGQ